MINKLSSLDSKVLNIGFLLVLLSKFYFLWGSSGDILPQAPLWIVAIRDVLILGFLAFGIFKIKNVFSPDNKIFWILISTGFFLSLFHFLVGAKTFQVWGQHYLRNVIVPLMFYPVIFGLLKRGFKF